MGVPRRADGAAGRGSPSSRAHVEPISSEKRLTIARRLLHDDQVDLRDRVAGLPILIYAQPVTRVAGLTFRLGISTTSAAKCYRLAGGEWNRYAAGSMSAEPGWLRGGL